MEMELEKQLKELEEQLQRTATPIIHNTEQGIMRMNEVRRAVPWRGREIAMQQEEAQLGGIK